MPDAAPQPVSQAEWEDVALAALPYAAELARWLGAEAAKDRTERLHRGLQPVTLGRQLTFELWDVDDEAQLRFEGMERAARRGEPKEVVRWPVSQGPRSAIVLDLRNSGGGRWGFRLRVGDPNLGRPLIDVEIARDDGPIGQRHLFLWSFDVVRG